MAESAYTPHPNPSPEGEGLVMRDKGTNPKTPPLQGRGKGWGLSREQLVELHKCAREMRTNPTEPEKRLWRNLSNSQLGGFKFRRQEVIGRAIVDFYCPARNLVVEVDGETHADPTQDGRRDAYLHGFGLSVLHVTNHDVMHNAEGVLTIILAAIEAPYSPHPNPSPGSAAGRSQREGLLESAHA